MGREMSGLIPWGSRRAFYPLSLSPAAVSPIRISIIRVTISRTGTNDLIKVGEFVYGFVNSRSLPCTRVYSVINLISVYTIHTRCRCESLSTREYTFPFYTVVLGNTGSFLTPFHPFVANQHHDETASWLPAICDRITLKISDIFFYLPK